ncbi:hypothetical protein DH2020_043385 [Rehmannia glutinosa]|uniref:Uncharacterized protein n=1 Tax=Rehmannia glutinosa TaxID=99300 RepID=A0ABR0UJP7_REHGL
MTISCEIDNGLLLIKDNICLHEICEHRLKSAREVSIYVEELNDVSNDVFCSQSGSSKQSESGKRYEKDVTEGLDNIEEANESDSDQVNGEKGGNVENESDEGSDFNDMTKQVFKDLSADATVTRPRYVYSAYLPSSVFYVSSLFLFGPTAFVVLIAFRGLFKVRKNGGEALIYKRDRSLGGREVVVGKSETNWSTSRKSTPLSSDNSNYYYQKKNNRTRTLGRRRKKELPQWWPQVVNWDSQETVNKEEYQRMANQLIRAIMDRKMSGQDISTNDIVQLRHLCKTYGVRTFINTANARDSLYRVSVNFVLDYCESISNDSTSIQINGEDVREFIAGLADNIGLESTHAARMVSAAVAARTRSKILQAWALEVQNKHAEALAELFKVCLIHRIFPPEENSPEMEMVARGLDKSLSVEQREYILNSFISVCGQNIDQSVLEALGLGGAKDEQGIQLA